MASKRQETQGSSTTTPTTPSPTPTPPPTVSPPITYSPSTSTPSVTPTSTPTPAAGGTRIIADLEQSIYKELPEGYTYSSAIGVKGRKIFDNKGRVIRYEGYRYDNRLTSTSSGAGAATGTPMSPTVIREPKYFSGDENEIFGFAVEDLASLQRAMNNVGLLGDNYAPGTADNATRAAFTNLLEIANGYGEEYDSAILRLAATGAGRRGSIQQYKVSNENDVKSVIGQVSKQLLGRNLGEGDLNRLAQMYRNLEQQTGMATAGDQQQVVAAPSVETFATSKLGSMFPTETNARKFGSYIEAIKEKYGI